MDHDAAITEGPSWTARTLIADESVFDAKHIIRERLVVKQVAKTIIELLVLIVGDLNYSILNAKGPPKVVIEVVAPYFDLPAVEVLPVEQLGPFAFFGEQRRGNRQSHRQRCQTSK